MKKLKCIFIILLIFLLVLTSTCFGYNQYRVDGTCFFSVNDPFLGYAKNFPEYQEYLAGTYEIVLLWDALASHTCYMYFVEPKGNSYIFMTGRRDNEFGFGKHEIIRYKGTGTGSDYNFESSSRETATGGLIRAGTWKTFFLGFSTMDVLDKDGNLLCKGVQIDENRQDSTVDPPPSSGNTTTGGNTSTTTPPDYSSTGPLSWIANFFEYLGAILQGFFGGINDWLDPSKPNFILKNVEGFLSGITSSFDPSKPNFILKTVENALSGITSSFDPKNPNFILKTIENALSGITSSFDPTSDKFVFKVLIDMLTGAFADLFIPSEEDLNNLFAPVREKFAFVDKFNALSAQIQHMLETGEGSPVFKLKLSSKYVSGEFTILDLSFFAPYKPYSDMVITAFVYLLFAYRTIKHLPETISGLNSVSDIGRRC